MYYENFAQHITAKWQIVLEGWPLSKFTNPSALVTKNEVEILYNAFKMGTAKFRRLSDAEWESWDAARFQGLLTIQMDRGMNEDEAGTGPSIPSQPTPPTPTLLSHSAITAPADMSSHLAAHPTTFSMGPAGPSTLTNLPMVPISATVSSADGGGIQISKKPRKIRSDKGQKKGPRKGKENV